MQHWVIIVGGGSGTRMGSAIPKQFLTLHGRAIIRHTMERFRLALPAAQQIIVLPTSHIDTFDQILQADPIDIAYQRVNGGDTRYASVKNGLSHIAEHSGIIGVHDAVRPLVSIGVIQNAYATAASMGNAVPAIGIHDSIRRIDDNQSTAVDRSLYRRVQTPQCFDAQLLKKAYQRPFSVSFTDDASVVEATGENINLIPGNEENIKITSPVDIPLAAVLSEALH